jgi:hypothetical protein
VFCEILMQGARSLLGAQEANPAFHQHGHIHLPGDEKAKSIHPMGC